MILKRLFWIIVISFSICASLSNAADISIRSGPKERVSFPFEKPKYIYIEGKISEGDYDRFKEVAAALITETSSLLEVMVNSPGGDAREAMRIGRLIRDLFGDTTMPLGVYLNPDAPDFEDLKKYYETTELHVLVYIVDKTFDFENADTVKCYSACSIILFGGATRRPSGNIFYKHGWYGAETQNSLGLHRPRPADVLAFGSMSPKDAQEAYEKFMRDLDAYLVEMDVPKSMRDLMFATSSRSIELVDGDQLRERVWKDVDGKMELVSQSVTNAKAFLSEWLLARCGSAGYDFLEPAENALLSLVQSLRSEERRSGRLSPLDSLDYVPPSVSREEIERIETKIGKRRVEVDICAWRALKGYQTGWAEAYLSGNEAFWDRGLPADWDDRN